MSVGGIKACILWPPPSVAFFQTRIQPVAWGAKSVLGGLPIKVYNALTKRLVKKLPSKPGVSEKISQPLEDNGV